MKQMILFAVLIGSMSLLQNTALAHKPYNELQVSYANLKKYPQRISQNEVGIETTIGDLHGNALKLIYFLISNDVIKLSKENYDRLVTIYQMNPEQLTLKDIAQFQAIIDGAIINNKHKIRLLGDDLCDRGMNDYYTLYIFKKLDSANVPFDIVLSNHGSFFLEAFEQKEISFSYNPYGEGKYESVVQSMLNLGKIINKGLIAQQDVINIVQKHYLKHLKLSSYTVNKQKQEITLFSHAPIDLKILAQLAKDLNIAFNDTTLDGLIECLNRINARVSAWVISYSFTTHYEELNMRHKKDGTLSPLKQALWNRDYEILNRDYNPNNKLYGVNYVHGHDSQPNVYDLDTLFGKTNHFTGSYAIHVTHS